MDRASTADRVEGRHIYQSQRDLGLAGWDDQTCDKMNLVCEWLNDEGNAQVAPCSG